MRHVALFGLSANPPTNTSGHAGIVRHIATLVDELWVLPVFQHSFSSKRDLAPFDDRLAMCQLGLASAAPNVRVLDVERTVCEAATQAADAPVSTGSIDVLEALSEAHPDVSWSWVLGADTFADLRAGRWKGGDRLMARAHLFVVQRQGEAAPDVAGRRATLVMVPDLQDTSSTAVRAALAAGDIAGAAAQLHPAVLAHITRRGLYEGIPA